MSSARKILLIIPNLGRGGAQQVFRDQLQFYSQYYETKGCVFNFDDAFTDDKTTSIISLDVPAGSNFFSKMLCFYKRVVALRKVKARYKFDFCISHLEGADYVNLLSRRKEKVICWIHGSKIFDKNIEGTIGLIRKKILIPFLYRNCDLSVTVSEGIRHELTQHFKIPSNKTVTIYNNFDLHDISGRAAEGIPLHVEELFRSRTVLITHCRLSRQKNLFSLVDIFISTKSRADVRLVILGDGELREDLLQYCTNNHLRVYSFWAPNPAFGLDFDIYFFGYERNPYPFLRRAHLYLMTSSWEGFPLSLCEAMACGVPTLAADCYTGPREIISPGLDSRQPVQQAVVGQYGILMPLANKDTIKTWTDTIISLLPNDALRNQLIANASRRVLDFDREKVGAQWQNLIQESQGGKFKTS